MNDLTRMQCSEEIVVLGILRVVEEIRLRKPDAKIVVNSLLPMIDYRADVSKGKGKGKGGDGGGDGDGDVQKVNMADFADFRAKRDAVKRMQKKVDRERAGGRYPKREVPSNFRMRDENKGGGEHDGDHESDKGGDHDNSDKKKKKKESRGDDNRRLDMDVDFDLHELGDRIATWEDEFGGFEHDYIFDSSSSNPNNSLRRILSKEEREGKEEGSPTRRKTKAGKKTTKAEKEEREDNATEGPELERAMERRKKALDKMDKKHHNVDKVFRDADKYEAKKPVVPLLPIFKKKVLPPVWPSVHVINNWLKIFCSRHESITFFDSTPIFSEEQGGGGEGGKSKSKSGTGRAHRLYEDLISPRGHPTEEGFEVWETAIKERLHKMLEVKKTSDSKVKKVPPPSGDYDPAAADLLKKKVKVEVNPDNDNDNDDKDEAKEDVKDSGTETIGEGKEAAPPKDEDEGVPTRREDDKASDGKDGKGKGDASNDDGE